MDTFLFLFIYSILKAFLPLPSLEAILLPMCVLYPQYALIYSILTGVGTCIGGLIGYELSYHYGRKLVLKLVNEDVIEEGITKLNKLGYPFIVIGSLTPFPDFLLAYIAGLIKMNKWMFMLVDGSCRFIRSILLVYFSLELNKHFQIDRYVTLISILILVYFLGKFVLKKK